VPGTSEKKQWRIRSNTEKAQSARLGVRAEIKAPPDTKGTHSLEFLPPATLSLVSIALRYVTLRSASSIRQCNSE